MPVERCARCAAVLPPGAPWCTLCFAPVPAPVGPSGPGPDLPEAAGSAPQPGAPRHEQPAAPGPRAQRGWPCLTCGADMPMEAPACTRCGAGFLAGAAGQPGLAVPGLGNLVRRSRGQRMLLGAAAGLVLIGVLVLLMWLAGSLL